MTPEQTILRDRIRRDLQRVLAQEMALRPERVKKGEPWLLKELGALWIEATMQASRLGRRIPTLDEVRIMDEVSTGADWVEKITLRLADRILGLDRGPLPSDG